jgi:hypothetical protein
MHPLHFCSPPLCSLRTSHLMHPFTSIHFRCCTPPSSSHASCASLHAIVLPALHVESSAFSFFFIATLQLLCLFSPSVHHHWVSSSNSFTSQAVETLHLLLQSASASLSQLTALTLFQLSIASTNSLFSYWQIPYDPSVPLEITQKSLRVLWQKPSVVSSSYTEKCYSGPPIFFSFIYTVGLTSLNLAFILTFLSLAFRDHRGGEF